MNLTKHLIGYDQAHLRIDLRQIPAHLITLLLAVWWGVHDYSGTSSLIIRVIMAGVFLTITRWTACRLGASRLSSVVAGLLIIVFFWRLTAEGLAELTIFMTAVLATVEYFKTRSKMLALAYGALLGVLSTTLPDKKGVLILILCLSALFLRTVWHAVLERLSKIQLLLFTAKAVAIGVVAIGTHVVLDSYMPTRWAWQSFVGLPAMSPSFAALVVVIGLWGLWSTMLLATVRSPKHRGMRMFFIAFSLVTIVAVALLRRYGPDLFLPEVLRTLDRVGLTTYNAQTMIFAIFSFALLATAAIDRTLFKDVGWVRMLRTRIGSADR